MADVPKMGTELVNSANIGREHTEDVRAVVVGVVGGYMGGCVGGVVVLDMYGARRRVTLMPTIDGAAVYLTSTMIPLPFSCVLRKDVNEV